MKARTPEELWQAVKDDAPDLYFCPHAFEHLYNDNAGHWALCCRAYPLDTKVGDTTPEEHWKSPLMDEIRREMLSGELKHVRKYCWKCLKMEKDGLRSPRQQLNAAMLAKKEPGKSKVLDAAARMTQNPGQGAVYKKRTLELKLRVFGNYCQLRCYMCSPVNSTSRRQELADIRGGQWLRCFAAPERGDFFESEEDYDRFIESAVNLLPYVKKIKITGGEPFLLPRHYKFIERIIASGHADEIRLSYDTNMARFHLGSANVLDYLKYFKAVTLAVSVDNLGPRNDYIRYGSDFEGVIANIEKARAFPGINVVVSCATGILNAGDVHDIAAFFHERGLVAKFNMCVINWPLFLQARHLPDSLKAAYLGRLEASPHREQFANVIRMIRQPRDEAQYQSFLRYVSDLDAHRGTSWLDLWPEFRPHAHLGAQEGFAALSQAIHPPS
jgi:organic radical activating enzyme